MAEAKKWMDVWVFPWVAGLVLGLILYGIPELAQGPKAVTLFLDGPLPCVGGPAEGGAVAINGKSAEALYAYRVGIRNSGRRPLSQLPLILAFSVDRQNFSILTLRSQVGSGSNGRRVTVGEPDAGSRHLVYDVLQPGEEDTLTLLTNQPAQLRLYCRQKGLGVRLSRPDLSWDIGFPAWAVALFGVLACWLALGARKVVGWRVRSRTRSGRPLPPDGFPP